MDDEIKTEQAPAEVKAYWLTAAGREEVKAGCEDGFKIYWVTAAGAREEIQFKDELAHTKLIKTPDNYVVLADPGKELFRIDDGVKEDPFEITVSRTHTNGKKRDEPLTRKIWLNRENLKDTPDLEKRLTDFDLTIYNALCGVWESGDRITTSNILYRTFTGGKREPTATQRAEILASVDKMQTLRATIEFEQEAKEWKFEVESEKVIRRGVYRGNFIQGKIWEDYVNGVLVNDVIMIFDEPIFYTLAKRKNQISAYPRNLIRLPGYVTPRKLSLRDYLLDRISAMKHGKQKKDEVKRTILIESALARCGIVCDYENRKAVSRAADDMKALLTGWVEKEFISGFCYDHAGKKFIIAVNTDDLKELRDKHKRTEIYPGSK